MSTAAWSYAKLLQPYELVASSGTPAEMDEGFRDALRPGGRGPQMVVLPGGRFQMGSDDGDSDEKPVHRVSIDRFTRCAVRVRPSAPGRARCPGIPRPG